MAQYIKPRVPRGMRDILPEQMIRRQYVIDVIRNVFEEFGFEPLQTPAMELSEVLTGKYGPDAEKMIYQAGHTGGKEDISLRYDLSVPLCRVVAMYPQLPKPFKRYQIDPVWRAERPQKGRYRQFFQCDADTVGSESMLADAENVSLIYQVLSRLGFKGFTIHLNDRKVITGIGLFSGVPSAQLGGLYRSIDKLDKIGLDGVTTELRENEIPEDVIAKLLTLLQIEGDAESVLSDLADQLGEYEVAHEGISELKELISFMDTLGIPETSYQINVSMVRGLEYYTGPIYETVQDASIGSITGGGRYDELIGSFSKQGFPATGTSFGIERIIDLMNEGDMYPSTVGKTVTQVLMTVFDDALMSESLKLATRLRQGGIRTEVYHRPGKLSTQMKYADTKGIPYAVILGSDELESGTAAIRDLSSREQQDVPLDRIVEEMQRLIAG
ncbi:histidine--tRNA ligase [Candidatus Poribacteria bacterium]|nr:histidine--tRNA ligase [Candidatus Poribacteria bacterium]MYB63123.1 histidine--tRNA ligase [Candidatus Poribacteria bacterium]MYF55404.1 histidine--tRNA ligase [Candidatus Poribacteria bacterium]MYI94131.1 histidine--tRNA ligase [Candidatus Poribacteria bacterium]